MCVDKIGTVKKTLDLESILNYNIYGYENMDILAILIFLVVAVLMIAGLTIALLLQSKKPGTGMEGLIGEKARAVTAISSSAGKVFLKGEIWEARCSGEIAEGSIVVIEALEDNLVLLVIGG